MAARLYWLFASKSSAPACVPCHTQSRFDLDGVWTPANSIFIGDIITSRSYAWKNCELLQLPVPWWLNSVCLKEYLAEVFGAGTLLHQNEALWPTPGCAQLNLKHACWQTPSSWKNASECSAPKGWFSHAAKTLYQRTKILHFIF